MNWLLILYVLSTGFYSEKFITSQDCNEALMEAQILKGPDIWSAVCVGPDDETIPSVVTKDIGP